MPLLAPCPLSRRPALWYLLAVQAFSACSAASTMPDGAPLPVVFSSSRVYSSVPPAFEALPQGIHVTGIVPVNTPCYDFSATATLRGDTVDVVILATSRSGICQHELAAYQFDARISEVPTGTHTVTLRYKYEGFIEYETLVATTDLAVP